MRECEHGGGSTKAVREEEEGEEKETASAVDAVKIAALLGTFFVVWCFCSPHHSPISSEYKRMKELTFSTGVEKPE